jgi:NAD(P)-dependent dehydrogenase (short-subunit alcohol dehydrogenase family)
VSEQLAGRFAGKIAVVTGSTQGIGEAVARRLADEGAQGIVVAGRDATRGEAVARALTEHGTESSFVAVELSEPKGCSDLIEATDRRFGRIDTLINAAGIATRGTIIDTTLELWDYLMAVNARAPFLLMQGAIRIMRREGIAGTIVNVGSMASYGSVPYLTPYAASKGALMTLSRNVAYSVMWDRIRVNHVNPGWMDTPGEDLIQRRFHSGGQDWLEEAEARKPFGRLIKPDELAATIAFLASDDSGLMTGTVVDFDQSVRGAGLQGTPLPEETPV